MEFIIGGSRQEVYYKEAIKFIEDGNNEIYTIPRELIRSKKDLITIFEKANDLLRNGGILSGYDRISDFS